MSVYLVRFIAVMSVLLAGLGGFHAAEAQNRLLAQVPSGGTVQEIRIEGTQRIDPETVRSYLSLQPGDPFNAERIDQSLKGLFATGLFADVVLRRDGDALIVRVVENPIINRLAFEGNRRIEDDALQAEVQLRPRVVYTRTKVQNDVKRILDLYRRSGRFAATVEPKVIQLPQNRVDLVFEINEGSVTGIRSINFVGNKTFSNSRLQEIVQTRESRWYRFFSTDDTYDPDRLTYDRELLRKFYLSEGYADFRVVSAVAELTPDRSGFIITFSIEEGERYKFGKIDLLARLKDLDAEQLRPLITTAQGDRYNADEVERTITAITDEVGNRGFAFVDVRPRAERHREDKTVDITYEIDEGPRVYVERIDITGNVRTQDQVVRREFRLVEGDAFNTSKLRRSQQRLRNLNFFKKVDVNNVAGSAPDKTVITVEVEEMSTGELSLGAGFSTSDGVLGDVTLRERNLLGKGQDLRLGFTISQRSQQVDLSFTEPYFLNRPLAAGVDLFQVDRNNQLFASFDQYSLGGALRLGYQITENLRQTLRYTLRTDDIHNVASDASRFIKDSAGKRTTSLVGQSVTYDRLDSRTDPSDGYVMTVGTDFAGLGGDVDFVRFSAKAGYYYPLGNQLVLSTTGEAGYIVGLDQDVGIQNRYFVGGDNLRGFKVGGIGPRDLSVSTRDSLGGNQYYVGSVALAFPLGLPQELGLSARVFSDFGSLWGIDISDPAIVDKNSIRASAGFGLSWRSPLGPIRADFALPVVKESFDQTEFFRISFGTRF